MSLPLRPEPGRRRDERPHRAGAVRLRPDLPVLPNLPAPSRATEQYRTAAIQLSERLARQPRDGELVMVTSSEQGSGKTLTALNLALTVAHGLERRILLLEGDLYRPRLRGYFHDDRPSRVGLRQVLAGDVPAEEAVLRVEGTQLDVMFAGGQGDPAGVMTPPRTARVLDAMRGRYPLVLVDSPPLPDLASARLLLNRSDSVLLVARAGRSSQKAIEAVLETVGPKKLLGFVVNGVEPKAHDRYSYYYEE